MNAFSVLWEREEGGVGLRIDAATGGVAQHCRLDPGYLSRRVSTGQHDGLRICEYCAEGSPVV